MGYNSNVPATGHSGSQDYQDMQGNFAQIQTSFSVNHKALASGGGTEGYHTQIQLAAPVSDPNIASPVGSVYTKGTPAQLFFQNGSMAANVVQLTGNAVLSGSEYTIVTPWGLVLKLGIGSANDTGFANTFSSAFPTSAIGMLITPRHAGALSVAYTGLSTTGFTGWLQSGPGTQAISYLAWGT